jgi:hypothetical protein
VCRIEVKKTVNPTTSHQSRISKRDFLVGGVFLLLTKVVVGVYWSYSGIRIVVDFGWKLVNKNKAVRSFVLLVV